MDAAEIFQTLILNTADLQLVGAQISNTSIGLLKNT